jgi:predicted MFS family arabinose efflux permease
MPLRASRLLPATYRPLLAERHFRRFMPVFALSDLGDGMSVLAVAWLAVSIAPSGGQGVVVGAAVAAYVLPSTVGSLVLGPWARRLSAGRLLAADGWLHACALAAVPVAHVLGTLDPALYVSLLAASSLLHAWGKAGRHALFALLLPREQRLAANAVLSTSTWSSLIVGPALAGLLASVISPAWIIGLNAATFAVLAVRATTARLPAGPRADDAVAGLRVFIQRPELAGLLVLTWLFNAFFGPASAALPLFVARELGAGSGMLGAFWTAFGLGAVVGTLTLGLLRRLPVWPVVIGIIAGHGVCMLPFAWHAHWGPSLAGFALAGVVYGPYSALSFTLIQERTPIASLTTVLAARNAVVVPASPLGAAAAGPLLDRIGAGEVLVGSGAAMILLALAATLLVGLLRLRPGDGRPG